MNELERYVRSWGATAVPFGPLSDAQWVAIPAQQRAWTLLDQTAALRGVMLLSGGNGMGKSSLVGRWVRRLESRLYTPINLTQATLSGSGLLASLARGLGKDPEFYFVHSYRGKTPRRGDAARCAVGWRPRLGVPRVCGGRG